MAGKTGREGRLCSCILEHVHLVLWLYGGGGGKGRGGKAWGRRREKLRVFPPVLLCGSPQKNVTVDRALQFSPSPTKICPSVSFGRKQSKVCLIYDKGILRQEGLPAALEYLMNCAHENCREGDNLSGLGSVSTD